MSAPVGTGAGKILPLRQSSQPLSSYGVSVEQVERWHIFQIKPKKKKIHTHSYILFCFYYLSLDVRSETGQCTEEAGNVMLVSLWDVELSEAGFVLANSITYFSMSGSGNRAGPEPYFTYLWGKDSAIRTVPVSRILTLADKRSVIVWRVNGKAYS